MREDLIAASKIQKALHRPWVIFLKPEVTRATDQSLRICDMPFRIKIRGYFSTQVVLNMFNSLSEKAEAMALSLCKNN